MTIDVRDVSPYMPSVRYRSLYTTKCGFVEHIQLPNLSQAVCCSTTLGEGHHRRHHPEFLDREVALDTSGTTSSRPGALVAAIIVVGCADDHTDPLPMESAAASTAIALQVVDRGEQPSPRGARSDLPCGRASGRSCWPHRWHRRMTRRFMRTTSARRQRSRGCISTEQRLIPRTQRAGSWIAARRC